MPQVTEADMASNGRVATVRVEVGRALLRCVEADPDLTYEELLEALLDVAHRQAQHLRRGDESTDA